MPTSGPINYQQGTVFHPTCLSLSVVGMQIEEDGYFIDESELVTRKENFTTEEISRFYYHNR